MWLLPKPRTALCLSQVGERRRLASPNKDISPLNKSMLTVCLHRLGDSPTLWFLIRCMMRRREIGIWAEACCMGPGWFDCVCISSASIDGNDFDPRSTLSPSSGPSQVENTCISHSYFNKPLQPPYKDGRLYFLCWLNRMSTRLLKMKREHDGENSKHFLCTFWNSLSLSHTHDINKLIFSFYNTANHLKGL